MQMFEQNQFKVELYIFKVLNKLFIAHPNRIEEEMGVENDGPSLRVKDEEVGLHVFHLIYYLLDFSLF